MKVLVTGAGGYIGSQACKALKQAGHQIVCNDRRRTKHQYYDSVELGNYGHIDKTVLDTVDAVVHIAATSLVGPSVTDPATYYRNNVSTTLDLLESCKASNIKNFVFASSSSVYGATKKIPFIACKLECMILLTMCLEEFQPIKNEKNKSRAMKDSFLTIPYVGFDIKNKSCFIIFVEQTNLLIQSNGQD